MQQSTSISPQEMGEKLKFINETPNLR